ncbi:MAG: hypothetical protein WA884_03595, partial [Methyloceanibacter sp.]
GDLSAVEVREIGVDSDLKVTLPGLQIGCERALASLQVPELIADTTRVAVTPGNEVQAAFDATLDLLKVLQKALASARLSTKL